MSARVSKPWIEAYTVGGKGTKAERRWAVCFRVTLADGKRARRVKIRGHERKGLAETRAEQVRFAALHHDGWSFDDDWRPVHASDVAAASGGESVVDALETYWRLCWPTWSPAQRAKVRGRLLVVAASLLDDADVAASVVGAMAGQVPTLGRRRTAPTDTARWVARYLYDRFLPSCAGGMEETDLDSDPKLEAARDWLRLRSMKLAAVTDVHLGALRRHLGGDTYSTRRTYWTVVAAFLTWAVTSGRLERDPSKGLPKLTRDVDGEQVDPERIPGEDEVWQLADTARALKGPWFAALILLQAYGAFRISEAVGFRVGNFERLPNGGLAVTLREQVTRQARRHADDNTSTTSRRKPKGRSNGPKARRTVYIPGRAAAVIIEHLDTLGADPDTPVFTGPRGGQLFADTVRDDHWRRVVATLFPEGHRLAGITTHALRHFGMSL
jgi:integrase